ncbi:MAG TPA: carboxypeptidase regulatory-like domain-containing protein [Candidatus Binatus sp.]|nr:carboxypeptidase regulatory-like domain-containing protein [Candidatus Binatus sp.]
MRALRIAVVLLLPIAAACGRSQSGCETPRTATPLDRAVAGRITGSVRFDGTPPPMKPITFGGDPQCAANHAGPVLSGDAIVHDGRVENAFVYVKDGLGDRVFAAPDTPVTIDQAGCLYTPHVAGTQTCQPVQFVNSDPVLHNVHGTPSHSPPWNFGMAVRGSQRSVRVPSPEVMIDVRCDVHPWMRAYLGVLDHPYFAVTGADGQFTLADVPPGEYVVASWHERFGTREARVTVGAREAKDVSFTYAAQP